MSWEASPTDAPPHRALVIDDECAVRAVLRRWLQRRGWEVEEASDGSVALTRLHAAVASDRSWFDLIICDLRMPALSGQELHAWAVRHHPQLVERLIFASGDVTDAGIASFLENSGCQVLEKPFEMTTLDRMISRVAGRRNSAPDA